MKDGKTVKINTTESVPSSGIGGISDTLDAMNEWDMNEINDVGGSHGFNGPSTLGGKK